MKRNLFILLSILYFGMASAQTVILNEGFEGSTFPPTGWSSYSLNGISSPWERNHYYSAEGTYSAFHDYWGSNLDDWLVLPRDTINGPTVLSFMEFNEEMSYYGYSGVMISTGSGDPNDGDFVELKEFSQAVNDFTLRQLSLSDYIGDTIYIAFRYTGSWNHDWYIDNVNLTQYPIYEDLSLNNLTEDEFTTGPVSTVDLVVENKGTDTILAGAQVDMYVDNVYKSTLATGKDLIQFNYDTLSFAWTSGYGKFDLMFVKKVSDDSTNNDTLKMTYLVNSQGSFIEDFENQNGNINPGYKFTGSYSYFTSDSYEGSSALYLAGEPQTHDTLYLNQYSIDANSRLAFYYKTGYYGFNLGLIYSVDGKTWSSLGTQPVSTSTYQAMYYDLSALQGQNVYLAFVYSTDFFYANPYLYLDKLMLPKKMAQVPSDSIYTVKDTNMTVVNNANIIWYQSALSAATIDNVRIYFGTDGGGQTTPTNIINGSINNYTYITEDLDFGQVYYLQIVPENSYGTATDAHIWTISSPDRPYYTPDYTENFQTNGIIMPLDWIEGEGILTDTSSIIMGYSDWTTNYYLNGLHGYNNNSLNINLYYSNQEEWIFSPNIILDDKPHMYKLDFEVGITAYASTSVDTLMDDDSVAVLISNGKNWGKDNVLLWITDKDSIGLEKHFSLDIPAKFYNDTVRLAWYAKSTVYNNDIDIFIDSVTVSKISEDAQLSNILVDGDSLAGFDPGITDYQMTVPPSAGVPSTIVATASDTNAAISYKRAASVDDVDSIIVTAVNPDFTETYTIAYVLASDDASLKDLQVNDSTVDGFASDSLTYIVELPEGDSLPVVSATTNNANASSTITQVSSLPDTATVLVTAEDPSSSRTYTIIFNVLSIDASLKDLQVNNTTVDGFLSDNLTYNVQLPSGSAIPVVSATANNDKATVSIEQATVLPGTATVLVIAEYQEVTQMYTVNFTTVAGLQDHTAETVKIYPNPASNYLTIETGEADFIKLTSMDGKVVYNSDNKVFGKTVINLSVMSKGSYLIEIGLKGQIIRRILLIK